MHHKNGNTKSIYQNVLIVLDNLESDWAPEVIGDKDSVNIYHLFTIGFSPAQVYLKYDSILPDLRQKVKIVETSEISTRAERDARKFYLEMIKDFPRQEYPSRPSIMKSLHYRGRNLWWYLEVCEKNIWNDPFIHRIFALLRLLYTCENGSYQRAVLHVNDRLLKHGFYELLASKGVPVEQPRDEKKIKTKGGLSLAFSQLFQVSREIIKTLLTMATLKIAGLNTKGDIAPETIGFFSTYPDWWRYPFLENAEDLFFDGIPDALGKERPVRHFLWLMPWHSLFKRKKEAIAFFRSRPITVLESEMKTPDVLSLLDPRLFFCCLKAWRACQEYNIRVKGVDLSSWVRDAFYDSMTSPMFFNCLSLDRAVRRIPLEKLRTLFYRLEFQPLERAILNNTTGRTITVGFQHSALGNNFLNYVFADGELGEHWVGRSDPNSMSLPDHIFTSGDLGVKFMRRAGYPEERLAVAGALRFRHLYDYARRMPSRESLRNRYNVPLGKTVILVATSPLLQETICMLTDLFAATKQSPFDIHVLIRCHPEAVHVPGYVDQLEKIAKNKGGNSSHDFLSGPVSLQDYISLSDAVLLTGGTVALEAMLLGCLPLIYTNVAQFSHNPMKDYPDAVLLIDNPNAMKAALDIVCNGKAAESLRPLWERPLRDMFSGTSEDPGVTFLKAISNQLHISC